MVRRVLAQGLAVITGGLILSLIGSRYAASQITDQLHDVAPTDPVTWLFVPTLIVTVGLGSVYVAAALAGRTDPATLLRSE